MLAAYPFLLAIVAGFAGAVSAVLLRRASRALGSQLLEVSIVVDGLSALAILWGGIWAWGAQTAPTDRPLGLILVGWSLALAGGALAGWATRQRGLGPLRRWSSERFELYAPYRWIRRPIPLGVTALAAGLALLRGTAAVGVWLAAASAAWWLALELGDWELSQRLPAARDYLRRTPRLIPRREGRRMD